MVDTACAKLTALRHSRHTPIVAAMCLEVIQCRSLSSSRGLWPPIVGGRGSGQPPSALRLLRDRMLDPVRGVAPVRLLSEKEEAGIKEHEVTGILFGPWHELP